LVSCVEGKQKLPGYAQYLYGFAFVKLTSADLTPVVGSTPAFYRGCS